jgi:hypothetical protein
LDEALARYDARPEFDPTVPFDVHKTQLWGEITTAARLAAKYQEGEFRKGKPELETRHRANQAKLQDKMERLVALNKAGYFRA